MAKYSVILLCERNGIIPLGLGCIKAYVDADKSLSGKVSVSIKYVKDIASPKAVLKHRPDLVGFSCCGDVSGIMKACAELKAADNSLDIVIGGPSTSAIDQEELFSNGAVDFVVRGEGEITFKELLGSLLAARSGLKKIPGLVFRHKGGLVANPPRAEFQDLDALPSPYLNGIFDLKNYTRLFFEASRGCRFTCNYCSANGSGLRYFSEQRLAEEVRYILKNAPQAVTVSPIDADFFLNPARAFALTNSFRELSTGYRASFVLTSNPHNWDDRAIAAFCSDRFQASIGVQSTNPRALSSANRRADIGALKRKLRRFERLAPAARFSIDLIDGLPGDDLNGYKKTLDWAISTGGDLELNHLMVLPNTYFGRNKKRLGIVCGKAAPYPVISNITFSKQAMQQAGELISLIGPMARNMSLDKFITSFLLSLGSALRGKVKNHFLCACEELSAFIQRDPRLSVLKRELSGSSHGEYSSPDNLTGRADILDMLLGFGIRILKAHGRTGLRNALTGTVAAAKGRLLFRQAAADRAGFFGKLTGSHPERLRTLLVCWADSGDQEYMPYAEALLLRDPFTRESYANREGLNFKETVAMENAAAYLKDLSHNSGRGYDAVILSGIYGSIPLNRQAKVLKALRALATEKGRLIVFDDLAGPPAFDAKRKTETETAMSSALSTAGWDVLHSEFLTKQLKASRRHAVRICCFMAKKGGNNKRGRKES